MIKLLITILTLSELCIYASDSDSDSDEIPTLEPYSHNSNYVNASDNVQPIGESGNDNVGSFGFVGSGRTNTSDQMIEVIDLNFSQLPEGITGFPSIEALIFNEAERQILDESDDMLQAYLTMTETPPANTIMLACLPSAEQQAEVFNDREAKMRGMLSRSLVKAKDPVRSMKFINALLTLGLLSNQDDRKVIESIGQISKETPEILHALLHGDCQRIPRHSISNEDAYRSYAEKNMPDIRAIFCCVHDVLSNHNGVKVLNLREFIANDLATRFTVPGAFDRLNATSAKPYANIAAMLEDNGFINRLERLCQDGEGIAAHPSHLKLAVSLCNTYDAAYAQAMEPLTEALAFVMRGHNAVGTFHDMSVRNVPACAEGAYLGILRVLQEVQEFGSLAAGLAHLEIQDC